MANGNGNGNGRFNKVVTGKDVLNWLVPALLAFVSAGIVMIISRLDNIEKNQLDQHNRLLVIESSRFTAADGMLVWRELDKKVGREELSEAILELRKEISSHD